MAQVADRMDGLDGWLWRSLGNGDRDLNGWSLANLVAIPLGAFHFFLAFFFRALTVAYPTLFASLALMPDLRSDAAMCSAMRSCFFVKRPLPGIRTDRSFGDIRECRRARLLLDPGL